MSPYTLAQKTRYRITLDIEAFNDFEPIRLTGKNSSCFKVMSLVRHM